LKELSVLKSNCVKEMKRFFVKTRRWGNPLLVQSSQQLKKGEVVVIETNIGIISAIVEREAVSSEDENQSIEKAIFLRKANLIDLKNIRNFQKKEQEALKICRKEVKKINLPMKIIEANYSLDGSGITFVFTADGRVDFRELVKILSKKMQRSIRFHQIGARDESRQVGGFGICGRELCCSKFKNDLPSISSEMAKIQQIAHRGSERISGVCGRLMCCLAFEEGQYRELTKEFPKPGEKVEYKGDWALVKEVNLLNRKVGIELKDKTFIFVDKNELE